MATPLRNASYSYTDAGRLQTASGTWGADSYSWDANDNRTRADRTVSGSTASDVATLTPGTNRLAELKDGAGVVSRSFTHTPGGDTASVTRPAAPTLAYSYDARGRLSSVVSGTSQIASYAYDWREQRVSASSTEVGARHYLYAEDGQLLAEHDAATGALLREYVWLDTMPLAMVSGAVSTPTYTWITTGNLNESLLLTNSAGQVTASTTRDPWGNPILLAGGEPLDLGYPGQWRDASTGLSQNWHRDYDPTLGRYVEADPLGLGGGSNLFAYVGGDPVNMVDPMGLKSAEALAAEETLRRVIPKAAVRVISRPSRKIPVIGQALLVGDILGSTLAIAKFCYDHSGDDVDEDGPCEFQKRDDELECNQWNITGAREGYSRQQGYALCMKSVMARYAECRAGGMNPNAIRTPLFLPTRRRGGPDRIRPRW